MKSRPILFSGPMVRALLDGSKTQTRRRAKEFNKPAVHGVSMDAILRQFPDQHGCKYGQPGDKLWVRETYRLFDSSVECACYDDCSCSKYHGKPLYRATESEVGGPWKPSIFMPRAACRITLEITSARVERLNDISEADAMAEGIDEWGRIEGDGRESDTTPQNGYRELWERINGPGSWALNPFVWVLTFNRIKP